MQSDNVDLKWLANNDKNHNDNAIIIIVKLIKSIATSMEIKMTEAKILIISCSTILIYFFHFFSFSERKII